MHDIVQIYAPEVSDLETILINGILYVNTAYKGGTKTC